MKTVLIKPGLLVGLTSEVSGGVRYQKKYLGTDRPDPRISRWETTKTTDDPEELQRASAARSAARSAITSVCIETPVGLLCPQDRVAELDAAVTEAERIVAQHNASALHTWVSVNVLPAEIVASSERSNRAIAAQMAGLVDQMRMALETANPKAMREVATKAKSLSAMLAPAQEEAALAAVESVRRAAPSGWSQSDLTGGRDGKEEASGTVGWRIPSRGEERHLHAQRRGAPRNAQRGRERPCRGPGPGTGVVDRGVPRGCVAQGGDLT